jgi:exopolyphosphatase/pppGpp-phosphohydrolase
MPIIPKKNINILDKTKNTVSFNKELNSSKQVKLNSMTCDIDLINKFNELATKRKWNKTTLMNEILRDYFDRLENSNNEDD